jgi:hypothetical protein
MILQGSVVLKNVNGPLIALGGSDGAAQMSHFVKNDDLNLFRLRAFIETQAALSTDIL